MSGINMTPLWAQSPLATKSSSVIIAFVNILPTTNSQKIYDKSEQNFFLYLIILWLNWEASYFTWEKNVWFIKRRCEFCYLNTKVYVPTRGRKCVPSLWCKWIQVLSFPLPVLSISYINYAVETRAILFDRATLCKSGYPTNQYSVYCKLAAHPLSNTNEQSDKRTAHFIFSSNM